MSDVILLIHLAATGIMTGVIWVTQLVTYPELDRSPPADFPRNHARYTRRIGLIVGPAMITELLTGIALLASATGPQRSALIASLVLLAAIWLSTTLIQIPCHNRLGRGYDAAVHRRLVTTNWIRTGGWSARLLLLLIAT
ncbi:MAG TPA: hypothetical protein PKC67_09640 [Kiritimatiellia bacterium]|nr:hypothetical protein [Kiritimatiellia bacterium]HMP34603.1 hypothetical protein [Kiritimatiellia bacterium]